MSLVTMSSSTGPRRRDAQTANWLLILIGRKKAYLAVRFKETRREHDVDISTECYVAPFGWIPTAVSLMFGPPHRGQESGAKLADLFAQQVDRRLIVLMAEQHRYAELLSKALADAGLQELRPQYIVLVDRNVFVQAAIIFWKSESGDFVLIGASPASTGKPGRYEHFETPTGVFNHSAASACLLPLELSRSAPLPLDSS
jgi:hypothetical protein